MTINVLTAKVIASLYGISRGFPKLKNKNQAKVSLWTLDKPAKIDYHMRYPDKKTTTTTHTCSTVATILCCIR